MASGVSRATGEIVVCRDGQCAARATHPEGARPGEQIHHRKPRRMGGTKDETTNLAANLIWLCRACHEWVESHRNEAKAQGWILGASESPAKTPLKWRGKYVYLHDDGRVTAYVAAPWPQPS